MAMEATEIESMIRESIPDAKVTIQDLKGDGDHYAALVISKEFEGISRVKQHQMVYKALKGKMGDDLHALALQTSVSE
ncbi:MAG: BolA family transcriptional regulator [Emcibacter sp.]|nr:BolA family transcriptional regulator [Emcibacter sp.]